jgi:hypothetical protein
MPNILEQISGLCDKQVHVRPTNESAVCTASRKLLAGTRF